MFKTFICFSIAIYKCDRRLRRAGRISESFISDRISRLPKIHAYSKRERRRFSSTQLFTQFGARENLGTKIFSLRPDSFPLTTRRVAHDFPLGRIRCGPTKKKPRTENKNRVCMRHNLSASV